MRGGTSPVNGTIYSYYVPLGGYAPNGDLAVSSDSVMGDWFYNYDTLSRLTSSQNALATSVAPQYAGQFGCWSYDQFGNRTQEGGWPPVPVTIPSNYEGAPCPSHLGTG